MLLVWSDWQPPRPAASEASASAQYELPHPGTEYTVSRDTNRYVRGFDHFCEFVGNDIGRGNLVGDDLCDLVANVVVGPLMRQAQLGRARGSGDDGKGRGRGQHS